MKDIDSQLADLVEENKDLKARIHANEIAIITLAIAINGIAGEEGLLGNTVEAGWAELLSGGGEIDEKYQKELLHKVTHLLGKA